MMAFMVLVIGAAVSLAAFFLGRALTGITPRFDRHTLDAVGTPGAFILFCGAGPVLLARSLDNAADSGFAVMLRHTTALTFMLLIWTGSLGILAVESLRPFL